MLRHNDVFIIDIQEQGIGVILTAEDSGLLTIGQHRSMNFGWKRWLIKA